MRISRLSGFQASDLEGPSASDNKMSKPGDHVRSIISTLLSGKGSISD